MWMTSEIIYLKQKSKWQLILAPALSCSVNIQLFKVLAKRTSKCKRCDSLNHQCLFCVIRNKSEMLEHLENRKTLRNNECIIARRQYAVKFVAVNLPHYRWLQFVCQAKNVVL